MKKKLVITAAIFCSLITILWIINLFTGMLMIYKIPTPSNMPNVNPGDRIYASSLKRPTPYNFIIYTNKCSDSIAMIGIPEEEAQTGSKYLHRLCGVPGDVIEMKNGVLFVNNRNFDTLLNLNRTYKINNTEFYSIDQEDIIAGETSGNMHMISNDTALVTFDRALLKKYAVTIKPILYIEQSLRKDIFVWNGKSDSWTTDNFGPLKIPSNCYFVLGDNRHNALDSRYIGFVKKEDIKGVVLNK